jgi:FixJ family two-component response regulator
MSCAIVDADSEYRSHLAKVLDDLGFLVLEFGDSRCFIVQNKECRFDIVILSWNIEPIPGVQVVEAVRENGEPYPSLIVECDGGESVSLQLVLAPIGFLFKPFDAQHLMQVLEKAIGG